MRQIGWQVVRWMYRQFVGTRSRTSANRATERAQWGIVGIMLTIGLVTMAARDCGASQGRLPMYGRQLCSKLDGLALARVARSLEMDAYTEPLGQRMKEGATEWLNIPTTEQEGGKLYPTIIKTQTLLASPKEALADKVMKQMTKQLFQNGRLHPTRALNGIDCTCFAKVMKVPATYG